MAIHHVARHANADAGEHTLGVSAEVAINHPVIIAWFVAQNVFDTFAFVFAKVEDFAPIGIVDKTTSKVYIAVEGSELGKAANVLWQIVVAFELSHEDVYRGRCVGKGAMGIDEVFVAIEFIGGNEGTLLFFVESSFARVGMRAFIGFIESG